MSTNPDHEPQTENLTPMPQNDSSTPAPDSSDPAPNGSDPAAESTPAAESNQSAEQPGDPQTLLLSEAPTAEVPFGTGHGARSSTATDPLGTSYAPPAATGFATSAAAPTQAPTPAWQPEGRQPRISTVVWGLIIALIGVVTIAAGIGARIDLDLAIIGLLVIAGIALVVGAVWSVVRNSANKGR